MHQILTFVYSRSCFYRRDATDACGLEAACNLIAAANDAALPPLGGERVHTYRPIELLLLYNCARCDQGRPVSIYAISMVFPIRLPS